MSRHFAIIVLVTLLPLRAYPADPTAKPPSPPQPIGLTPFVHPSDFFPILPWDALHNWKKPHRNPKHGLESIADCGFTMAGFVRPEDLPLCEKLGLAAIMAPDETETPWFGEWRKLPDQEIEKRVKEMVETPPRARRCWATSLWTNPAHRHFLPLPRRLPP